MAESSAVDVANHVFRGDEQLFLDANVWLLVQGLHGSRDRRVTTYSSALRRILEAKCRISCRRSRRFRVHQHVLQIEMATDSYAEDIQEISQQ